MEIRFSKSAATLALGLAFLATPVLLHSTSLFAINSAFAAKGGDGNGNGGGNGNGNSGGASNGNSGGKSSSSSKSEKLSSAKAEKTAKAEKAEKVSNGNI